MNAPLKVKGCFGKIEITLTHKCSRGPIWEGYVVRELCEGSLVFVSNNYWHK